MSGEKRNLQKENLVMSHPLLGVSYNMSKNSTRSSDALPSGHVRGRKNASAAG